MPDQSIHSTLPGSRKQKETDPLKDTGGNLRDLMQCLLTEENHE